MDAVFDWGWRCHRQVTAVLCLEPAVEPDEIKQGYETLSGGDVGHCRQLPRRSRASQPIPGADVNRR